MKKIVLIGGYPKGFAEPFHIKTRSGKILRKIVSDIKISPIFFDLWNNQKEEDLRKLKPSTIKQLNNFIKSKYILIALGRYIDKVLIDNQYQCIYLPHPASRDKKYINALKIGLSKIIINN